MSVARSSRTPQSPIASPSSWRPTPRLVWYHGMSRHTIASAISTHSTNVLSTSAQSPTRSLLTSPSLHCLSACSTSEAALDTYRMYRTLLQRMKTSPSWPLLLPSSISSVPVNCGLAMSHASAIDAAAWSYTFSSSLLFPPLLISAKQPSSSSTPTPLGNPYSHPSALYF